MSQERDREEEQRPVREAGGGEAEGFEEAERVLREEASHEDTEYPVAGDPVEDAGGPEETSTEGAVHGEPDEAQASEDVDEQENVPERPREGE